MPSYTGRTFNLIAVGALRALTVNSHERKEKPRTISWKKDSERP